MLICQCLVPWYACGFCFGYAYGEPKISNMWKVSNRRAKLAGPLPTDESLRRQVTPNSRTLLIGQQIILNIAQGNTFRFLYMARKHRGWSEISTFFCLKNLTSTEKYQSRWNFAVLFCPEILWHLDIGNSTRILQRIWSYHCVTSGHIPLPVIHGHEH